MAKSLMICLLICVVCDRLDKYYLLLRRVIYFSFQFLARESWDTVYLEAYTDMLIEGPLR